LNAIDTGSDGQRPILAAGTILIAIGIGLGAFGAHGLRAALDERALGWWQTGVDYHMWNALGLVALGAVPRRLGVAAALIVAGVLVFSGSLYVMALSGARWLGMVTPVGGLLMIAGWLTAAWRVAR